MKIVLEELQAVPALLHLVDSEGNLHPDLHFYTGVGVLVATILTVWLLYLGGKRVRGHGPPLQREYAIKSIFVYPVKSMAAVQLDRAFFDPYGLVHDRRFCVVDRATGKQVTQRERSKLARIQPQVADTEGMLVLKDPTQPKASLLKVPLRPSQDEAKKGERLEVDVFGTIADCLDCGEDAGRWLTAALDQDAAKGALKYRLVRVAPNGVRRQSKHAKHGWLYREEDAIHFPDGSPLQIASLASLDELNRRLQEKQQRPVPIDRFRPNIVVQADEPFGEDWWSKINIVASFGWNAGKVVPLRVSKPCHRCVVTTIPQDREEERGSSGAQGEKAEPLVTLREFRLYRDGEDEHFGKSPLFGVNACMESPMEADRAEVRVGDRIEVESWSSSSLRTAKNLKNALDSK